MPGLSMCKKLSFFIIIIINNNRTYLLLLFFFLKVQQCKTRSTCCKLDTLAFYFKKIICPFLLESVKLCIYCWQPPWYTDVLSAALCVLCSGTTQKNAFISKISIFMNCLAGQIRRSLRLYTAHRLEVHQLFCKLNIYQMSRLLSFSLGLFLCNTVFL